MEQMRHKKAKSRRILYAMKRKLFILRVDIKNILNTTTQALTY